MKSVLKLVSDATVSTLRYAGGHQGIKWYVVANLLVLLRGASKHELDVIRIDLREPMQDSKSISHGECYICIEHLIQFAE